MPDAASDLALQTAVGLCVRLAFGEFAVQICPSRWIDAGFGNRDAMEGTVELTVPAAVQPHPIASAGAGRDRRGTGLAGEVPVGGEALGAGRAADRRRRRRRADALLGEQVRAQLLDRDGQLALQRPLGAGEFPDAPQLIARDPNARGLLQARESTRDPI